jgi:hypothetical protein
MKRRMSKIGLAALGSRRMTHEAHPVFALLGQGSSGILARVLKRALDTQSR